MTATTTETTLPAWRKPEAQLAALIAVAVLLGGGGVAYAFNNLAVQLLALLILALNAERFAQFWRDAPRALTGLVALTLALPLVQLVPLPPAIWQQLPGRELVLEALDAARLRPGWRPLSLDPARTFVAALGLIVPLTLLSIGWHLPMRAIARLAGLLVILGLANFIWGIPQVLSNGSAAIPYPENPMPGVMFGGFANRNSTGLFFAACLALALNLKWPLRQDWARGAKVAAGAIFLIAILLTQSRTAIGLGAVVGGVSAMRWVIARAAPKSIGIAIVAALIAIIFGAALSSGTRIEAAIDRFNFEGDTRLELWEDAAYSAQRFRPIGAGMGTFDEVFQLDESLEHLSARKAGRAHNDYLELAVEGGALALILLVGWILLTGRLAWRTRRTDQGGLAQAGMLVLLAIGLQSITDYPLRNEAVMAVAALALLMLARTSMEPRE